MKVQLVIKQSDLEEYLEGQEIIACVEDNAKLIHGYEGGHLTVLVDALYIIGWAMKEVDGMVKGAFSYCRIQKR